MKNIKVNKTMPKARNEVAAALGGYRASSFHHRTEERGGARNGKAKFMDDYLEDQEIQESLCQLDEDREDAYEEKQERENYENYLLDQEAEEERKRELRYQEEENLAYLQSRSSGLMDPFYDHDAWDW